MAEEEDRQTTPGTVEDAQRLEDELLHIAHMFGPYREDPVMRELCRIALKSVQEGWIRRV